MKLKLLLLLHAACTMALPGVMPPQTTAPISSLQKRANILEKLQDPIMRGYDDKYRRPRYTDHTRDRTLGYPGRPPEREQPGDKPYDGLDENGNPNVDTRINDRNLLTGEDEEFERDIGIIYTRVRYPSNSRDQFPPENNWKHKENLERERERRRKELGPDQREEDLNEEWTKDFIFTTTHTFQRTEFTEPVLTNPYMTTTWMVDYRDRANSYIGEVYQPGPHRDMRSNASHLPPTYNSEFWLSRSSVYSREKEFRRSSFSVSSVSEKSRLSVSKNWHSLKSSQSVARSRKYRDERTATTIQGPKYYDVDEDDEDDDENDYSDLGEGDYDDGEEDDTAAIFNLMAVDVLTDYENPNEQPSLKTAAPGSVHTYVVTVTKTV